MPRQHNNSRELPQHHPLHQRFFGSRSHALLPIRRELIGTSISDQRRGGAAGEDAAPEGPPPSTSYEPQSASSSNNPSKQKEKKQQHSAEDATPSLTAAAAIPETQQQTMNSSSSLDSQLFLQQCLPWSFMSAMTMPPQSSMLYTTPTMTSPAADASEIAVAAAVSPTNLYSRSGGTLAEGNNNQRNNGELLLTPPSFAGSNNCNSSGNATSIMATTPSVIQQQDHLSLNDSAAAAAAAAMASAMAMAPMAAMTPMTPMVSIAPMTPMSTMSTMAPIAPIASVPPRHTASLSEHRIATPVSTMPTQTIPTTTIQVSLPTITTTLPENQQQHSSDLQRSAISISNSKWNAALGMASSNDIAVGGGNGSDARQTALIKLAYLNVDQFYALQQLVRDHGEDWAVLGRAMGIRPTDLAKNWEGYSVDTHVTRQWTRDEMELLATCRQMGICCRTTAKIIGTKLPLQCRRKTLKPPLDAGTRSARSLALRRAASPNGGSESDDGDDVAPNETNTWDTGHGPLDEGVASTAAAAVSAAGSTLVTDLVERQVQASGTVDWALVSQQSGLTIQQCLEQSRYDQGKRLWKYSAGGISFDWELAQSMHQFVVQFYPNPTPINFAAVSNFLWVSMTDCIQMFDILRGRIAWSPSTIETVRTLWAQGWTGELIARHLSPTLSAAAFERQWVRIGRTTNSVNHQDVNPLIPRSIDDDSVALIRKIVADHHTAHRIDHQVGAILVAARQALPALDRPTVNQCVLALLSVHPMYDARRTRRTKPHNGMQSSIATSVDANHTTASSSYPLPPQPQEQEGYSTRMPIGSSTDHCQRNSGRWTHEETMMLMQYVRMSRTAAAIDWASFSESLGTKSAYQCKNKYRSMKRHGTLKFDGVVNQ